MATQGQEVAEKNAETVANVVATQTAERGLPFPVFDTHAGIPNSVKKWDMANESRIVRENNTNFKNLSLPELEGSVNQTGKELFTSRFVWSGMTLQAAVAYVLDSGQFEDAVDELIKNRESWDRETCQAVMSYNLYIVAKGWLAERQMADKSDLSKLWETNDIAGQDFQQNDTFIQLKSWTFGLNNGNPNVDNHGNKVVYYCWIDGEIKWSEDYTELTKEMCDKAYVDFETLRKCEWVEVMNI